MIDIQQVGLSPHYVPYLDGWAHQRRIHADVVAGARVDTLLLLEHEAVYTAGKRTEAHERPDDGTPVIDVDRGGKITWHGPGQLVGYPIVRLPEPIDVVAHVRRLEALLIDASRRPRRRRLPRRGTQRRLGTAPPRCGQGRGDRSPRRKGVTMHGFAVNCDNTLAGFRHIVPCGISDAGVTTVSEVLGADVSPADLVPAIERVFRAEDAVVAA